MDDCIEREPLLKAFKEKCCQDCPGGYSHQRCHSWCDAASEIEMIENAPAVNNTPQQWQNSRLHPPTEADADGRHNRLGSSKQAPRCYVLAERRTLPPRSSVLDACT